MLVTLTPTEITILFRQDPRTKGDGGYQGFLVKLQKKVDPATGLIDLKSEDLEKIPRYAFDYGHGGWEDRLVGIFGRVLGTRLGRT
jgi:hypothetical protein